MSFFTSLAGAQVRAWGIEFWRMHDRFVENLTQTQMAGSAAESEGAFQANSLLIAD